MKYYNVKCINCNFCCEKGYDPKMKYVYSWDTRKIINGLYCRKHYRKFNPNIDEYVNCGGYKCRQTCINQLFYEG